MLENYKLPHGLNIVHRNEEEEEPERIVLKVFKIYNLGDFDKKILDYTLCKNMDWSVKNKTKKNKKINNKTKKN